MPNRSQDWLAQAQRDLNHAIHACDDEDFEWSCFSAQQASEKAIKAVFLSQHGEGWGHSVYALLRGLNKTVDIPESVFEAAKSLDKHYITTRYPNGFDQGIPGDYYTKKEAQEAIVNAREVIQFGEDLLRGQG